jgi:hypothetical protein
MIDFTNSSFAKLAETKLDDVWKIVAPLLVEGETAHRAFKGARDFIVFTDKRVIAVNLQGMTGKKRDVTSLPYAKVQAFSLESAGAFDLDAELELYFSTLGAVRFEFRGRTDVTELSRLIAAHVL